MLTAVHIRIQLKISQVTGLRDGISTVTNVEDSQTALRDSKTTIRQGNNIRMLTYITIAYLPLGFITVSQPLCNQTYSFSRTNLSKGLFSIGHATFMDSAGNVTFGILVLVFVLGTYVLALSLESIIDQWSRLRKEKWGTRGLTKSPPSHIDAESKLSFNVLGSCCGFRRRYNNDEEDEKISKAA
jgi:hypothetical protein